MPANETRIRRSTTTPVSRIRSSTSTRLEVVDRSDRPLISFVPHVVDDHAFVSAVTPAPVPSVPFSGHAPVGVYIDIRPSFATVILYVSYMNVTTEDSWEPSLPPGSKNASPRLAGSK